MSRDADRRGVETLTAAVKRWKDRPPIVVGLHRIDAYSIICGLQLLMRHPDIGERMRETFEGFGRVLQEEVSDDPEIYALLESGWNPAADVPRDDDAPYDDRRGPATT